MSRASHCRCLLCIMEQHLTRQFTQPNGYEAYREIATAAPSLSSFPTPSDLIGYLHSSQAIENAHPPKNQILAELRGQNSSATARELLLLAFVPMLHHISRQVLRRSPALTPDDIAQHIVTDLLASLGSPNLAGHDTHLAFAIARLLRRNAFKWASREGRGSLFDSHDISTLEPTSPQDGAQPIERAALLHHFLDRCHRRGVLSTDDLQLLVQHKLGESPSPHNSNATRQRLKRLLGKLRRAAGRSRWRKLDDRQLRLF